MLDQLRAGGTSKPSADELQQLASGLQQLATDPAKQRELKEEAKNVFRSTPKGLEAPRH